MDFHIGRLVEHLRAIGEYETTVFIFTSDNGSEAAGPGNPESLLTRIALGRQGYSTDYETLGLKGSFNSIGPSFASASASPLAYYKFHLGEGGLRVPLIISGAPILGGGRIESAFSWVTDLSPDHSGAGWRRSAWRSLWRAGRRADDRSQPSSPG